MSGIELCGLRIALRKGGYLCVELTDLCGQRIDLLLERIDCVFGLRELTIRFRAACVL